MKKTSDNIASIIENNPVIREAILISSNSLYKDIKNIKNIKEAKKLEQVLKSATKYLIRMSTRTTPYGAAAGVSIGYFEDKTDINLKNYTDHVKNARVDMEWLYKVLYILENDKNVLANVYLIKNSISTVHGNRLKNPFISNYGQTRSNKELDNMTASIRYTKQVMYVLDRATSPIKYNDLLREMLSLNKDVNESVIKSFVDTLIKNEYLITELRPPLTNSSPFDYIIGILSKFDNEYIVKLLQIKNLISEYNNLPLGYGEETYIKIVNLMKEFTEAPNYLQVDMKMSTNSCLISNDLRRQIESVASLMVCLSKPIQSNNYIQEYANEFLDKYGFCRLVPILELLDDEKGLGYPATYNNPPSNRTIKNNSVDRLSGYINNYFENKILETIYLGKNEVELGEDIFELVNGNNISSTEIPKSIEINAMLSYNEDKDDFLLHLAENLGSDEAGKTFGRFIDIMDEDMKKHMFDFETNQSSLYGDNTIIATIVELQQSGRLSNVALNYNSYDYEIAIATNNNYEKNRIDLDDLYIGAEKSKNGNNLFIYSKSLSKKVIVKSNNRLNYMLCGNIYRFLLEISIMNKRNVVSDFYDYIKNTFKKLDFTPRIKYDKCVVYPKTWRINRRNLNIKELKISKEEFYKKIKAYCDKWNVDKLVYLIESDNRLLLNLDNMSHVGELYNTVIAKNAANTYICEIERDIYDRIAKSDDKKFFAEIVAPLSIKKELNSNNDSIDYKFINNIVNSEKCFEIESNRVFVPFDEWISLKLYSSKNRFEDFIGLYILPFCEELIKKGYIQKFFYLRYADPNTHIRLRFKISHNYEVNELIACIKDWLSKLYEEGLINEVCIDTYKRETERYGGLEAISYAESIFFMDSIFCASFLEHTKNKNMDLPLEVYTAISIVNIITELGLSYKEQYDLFINNYSQDSYREYYRKYRKDLLKICNDNKLWEGFKEYNFGEIINSLFLMRKTSLNEYSQILKKYQNDNSLTNDFDSIVFSIIHMHCNRLLKGRDMEYLTMVLVRHTLFDLAYLKKEK